MMSSPVKPSVVSELREIAYGNERWMLLRKYRKHAESIMLSLEKAHLPCILYGSVARGDIDEHSDIDIFIPECVSSFSVENALEKANIPIITRFVVQATPSFVMKAYLEVNAQTNVSFPLMPMTKPQKEFFTFSGAIDLDGLLSDKRVPGVDKRLMLIEPTSHGHIETSIAGQEDYAAKILSISAATVRSRVRVLLRRDTVGRTGLFIKRELHPNETFEQVLQRLACENPAVRRRLHTQ
jgi:predicted nucleotidyltransferase